MPEPIIASLGPFQLRSLLGRGGMGEVWRAEHGTQNVPVAVKVMTAERARAKRYRAAFGREVRAVARLEHPGITAVFDHGEVSEQAERRSEGMLVAGSPYLVMELARHGTLTALEPVASFGALRRILMELLDALAHAHARGVVHRDIKPANVLLDVDDAGRARVRLSDFGIAHATDRIPSDVMAHEAATGTPGYMATEQILGHTHQQGPWTDLYSLGCVGYRLATGQAPYSSPDAQLDDVIRAHLHADVPPLVSRFPVPPGFGAWLRRLLRKSPFRRFLRAADAAQVLMALPDVAPADGELISTTPPSAAPTRTAKVRSAAPTITLVTRVAFRDVDDREVVPPESTGAASYAGLADEPTTDGEELPVDAPPIPATWRRPDPPRRPARMIGVGLGLYGVRPLPLVGRERERDAIWSALRRVARERRSQVVLLRGRAGTGKSCLAEWMGQRSHEIGAATVLKATYSPIQGPADGLRHMLARQLRCIGLHRAAMQEQIHALLEQELDDDDARYQAEALTELISPAPEVSNRSAGDQSRPTIRFASWTERYAVVHRLLAKLAVKRPVIVWLDDVQWGASSLGFALHVLAARRQLPVLLLLTLREEALAGRELEESLVRRLSALPQVTTLPIEPLDREEHHELVRELLGLEGELTEQVCQRTAGNPLFAVQLIGDWVQRGVLEVGDTGFRLRAGEHAELPDDIHQLWREQIEHLESELDGQPVLRSLQLAAALGEEVAETEWQLACKLGGWAAPAGLAGAMIERRLARTSDLGWAFTHGMLRESLQRGAQASGCWEEHHRLCATMLQQLHGDRPDEAERIARHLLAAGDLERALEPMLDAAERRRRLGDFGRARALISRREEALETLEVSERDPRRASGWLVAARALLDLGDVKEARSLLERAARSVTNHPSALGATVLRWRAEAARRNADIRLALELGQQARDEFADLGDEMGQSDCLRLLADCHLDGTGEHETAQKLLEAARTHYRAIGDGDRLAECDYHLSKLLVEHERLAAAEQSALAALTHHEQRQNRWDLACCHNQLGEIARLDGRREQAHQHYHRAMALLDDMGSNAACAPRLNLALMAVQDGRYGEALPAITELRLELESQEERRPLCYLDYAMLTCHAHDGDWASWDEQYRRALAWRPTTAKVDKDLAALAQRAGDLALAAAEPERARQAYELAREHWLALGKADRVQEVDRRLRSCGT
ncbi:MAG: protein kinase [Deltaproteobacteria bacterium]|jgi:serine/threonine protein kinase/tetratricopeptide (TPR) repeat protein|nr:protein kinase [Deltaproteobacteria bacterium]MBW2533684.1 protein kinase [Deltaproteobacteria bacterium]